MPGCCSRGRMREFPFAFRFAAERCPPRTWWQGWHTLCSMLSRWSFGSPMWSTSVARPVHFRVRAWHSPRSRRRTAARILAQPRGIGALRHVPMLSMPSSRLSFRLNQPNGPGVPLREYPRVQSSRITDVHKRGAQNQRGNPRRAHVHTCHSVTLNETTVQADIPGFASGKGDLPREKILGPVSRAYRRNGHSRGSRRGESENLRTVTCNRELSAVRDSQRGTGRLRSIRADPHIRDVRTCHVSFLSTGRRSARRSCPYGAERLSPARNGRGLISDNPQPASCRLSRSQPSARRTPR
ncbi:hypothetical protein amrb99_24800 [Actinomadura sp. RB99]|nr:hypothetical protein [Actinomadura sp. RB99]